MPGPRRKRPEKLKAGPTQCWHVLPAPTRSRKNTPGSPGQYRSPPFSGISPRQSSGKCLQNPYRTHRTAPARPRWDCAARPSGGTLAAAIQPRPPSCIKPAGLLAYKPDAPRRPARFARRTPRPCARLAWLGSAGPGPLRVPRPPRVAGQRKRDSLAGSKASVAGAMRAGSTD